MHKISVSKELFEDILLKKILVLSKENNKYWVEFTVKDEGIGISKEELTTIFKDFTQAKDSTSRLYGGTGLGLSISQKIVHLMDGDLTVRSELNNVFHVKG